MINKFLPIEHLRLFSGNGLVYHAFDHFIAARFGTLLIVPPRLVVGDLDEVVVQGCPVPHEEVYAVLEYSCESAILWHRTLIKQAVWLGMNDLVQQLNYLGIDPADCEIDQIMPMTNEKNTVLRLVHPCGIRYAVVMP